MGEFRSANKTANCRLTDEEGQIESSMVRVLGRLSREFRQKGSLEKRLNTTGAGRLFRHTRLPGWSVVKTKSYFLYLHGLYLVRVKSGSIDSPPPGGLALSGS